MEFGFNIHSFLKDEITLIDRSNDLLKYTFSRSPLKDTSQKDELREVINKLGINSAKAQGLNGSVTSVEQLMLCEARCYILKETHSAKPNGVVIGLLKVGPKKLFFVSPDSQQVEVTPLCVLDFYVHESRQRHGHGLKLFNFMMQREGVSAGSLAIDRPSDKMLSFYKKRFNLAAPIKQPNNFVVFRDFFNVFTATSSKRWTDQQRRGPITLKAISHNPLPDENAATSQIPVGGPPPMGGPPPVCGPPPVVKTSPPPHMLPPHAARVVAPPASHVPTNSEIQLPSLLSRPLSRLVSAPARKVASPSRLPTRERTFSWSRNKLPNVSVNYIVGGGSDKLVAHSRYTNFNRPRPF